MEVAGLLRPHNTKLTVIHQLLDAIVIASSYVALVHSPLSWSDRDSVVVIFAAIVFYTFSKNMGLYNSWRIASLKQETVSLCTAWIYTATVLLLTAGAFDVLQEFVGSEIWFWALTVPLLLIGWHGAFRLSLRQLRKRGYNTRSVGIIGVNALGLQLAEHLTESPWMGLNFKGFYDDRSASDERLKLPEKYEIKGAFDELLFDAASGKVDVVFIALPFQAEKRITLLINNLRNTATSICFAQDYRAFEILHGQSYVLGNAPLISVSENPFSGVSGVVKRIEDLVLGGLIIVLLAIPALIIAIGVKLSAPGPIIFRQRRYGLDGKQINVLKFRTMIVSEDGDTITQATTDDPRVTTFGRFLRRTSLDELPQFVNVLQGNMSIVGPRPHAVAHNEIYRKLVDSYMLRHKVKPGITGLAQIKGWRGETANLDEMQKRIDYDLEYIRNWSIELDLRIIALTVLGGFTGKKAY